MVYSIIGRKQKVIYTKIKIVGPDFIRQNNLRFGDILIHETVSGRTTAMVVSRLGIQQLKISKKSTQFFIPKNISRWIEDPATFYAEPIFKIELDTYCHQKLLYRISEIRRIQVSNKVYVSDGKFRIVVIDRNGTTYFKASLTPNIQQSSCLSLIQF